jgi:guanosine-3',5'-bis(diphosphate) 3'-pyrophosphohydrolase
MKSGDTCEIFTSKVESAGPSRDWLQFVESPRARNKIKQWFSRERKDEMAEAGKEAIARAIRKQNLPLQRLLTHEVLASVADEQRHHDVDGLYAAVGEGHISAQHVVSRLIALSGGEDGATEDLAEATLPGIEHSRQRRQQGDPGVIVKGMDDVWVKLARCCTPVPGDEIMGFITRGNGVSVHRTDCTNAKSLQRESERFIEVSWASSSNNLFLVQIQVEALDRNRLLSRWATRPTWRTS